jgi:hypothetical protein
MNCSADDPAMTKLIMKTNRLWIPAFAAVSLISLLASRAEAASYGVNLIVNGNGESGASSATGAPVVVPGWTTSSAFTVIPYGAAGGYPTTGDPAPPDHANQFFGGGSAAFSTATQEIDLSANASDINTGNVAYDLSGWFGGYLTDRDRAALTATFFNGSTLLGEITIGPASAKDRNFLTGFFLREKTGRVPVSSTRVVLTQAMTRADGNSNDGYADSLSLILTLKAGPPALNDSTFAGNGTRQGATGNWSNSGQWNPATVPNNTADNYYNPTITGLTLTVPLVGSPTGATLTRTFGEARMDVDTVISDLNLTTAGVTSNGLLINEHSLIVLGTTSDQSSSQPSLNVQQTGFLINAVNNDVLFSLGNFANFSGTTLNGTRLNLESEGPVATIQFNGAHVVTLNASVSLSGANAQITDENGNNGLRDLAVIGQNASLVVITRAFTTAGNLTVNGSLGLQDFTSGSSTDFTVNGNLTNFDPATRTLNGGIFGLLSQATGVPSTITFRFNGADIVNNGADLSFGGTNTQILDQSSSDGLRNFAHNLATGTLTFTDRNFTSSGAFTNDGSLSLIGQSLPTVFTVNGVLTNLDAATHTLQNGSYRLFGSVGTPAATATLRFNGADIVHNAAELTLGSGGMIRDELNRDGLRDFVDNQAAGSFELAGQSFTAPSDFTNAGIVRIDNFDATQLFSVAGGHSYIQTSGETDMGGLGTLNAANVLVHGGLFHNGGTINGNVSVDNGTLAPTGFGGGGVANFQGFIVVVPGSTDITGPEAMTVNGNLALSAGASFSLVIRNSAAGEFDTMTVSGATSFGGTFKVTLINGFAPQPGDSFTVLTAGSPITGAFTNVASGSRIQTSDGHGSFIATYSDNHLILSNFEGHAPSSQLLNISTRLRVQMGDNALIGGFIITGTEPKKVLIRGIGPSLSSFFSGALADPTLELYAGSALLGTNDNWKSDQQAAIEATGIPPADDLESAIVRTLAPGSYTAVLRGRSNTTGIGVVEAYDLDRTANSRLANISTRGFVETGDDVMIGGLIVGPSDATSTTVVVRAIGPTLGNFGIQGALQDPTLDLVNSDGVVVRSNNNWRDSQEAGIIATGLAPGDDRESALVQTVAPGNYTAIVRGAGNTTGVALVEAYHLP